MLFRSYTGPYLPSGEQLHVVEVIVQWWKYARALYSVASNNGKAHNKNTTQSRATSHEWIYARAPTRASKTANQCTNMAATRILYVREEAFYEKPHVLNQVIGRFSWPIRYCLEIELDTPPHPTTVTLRRMHADGKYAHQLWAQLLGRIEPSVMMT